MAIPTIKLSEQTFCKTGTKTEKWLVNQLPTKLVYPGKDTLAYNAGIRNIVVTKNFIDNKPYVSVEMKNMINTASGIEESKAMFKGIIEKYKNYIGKKG